MDYLLNLDTQFFLLINSLQNKFLDIIIQGINLITEAAFLWFLICIFIFIFSKEERKRKVMLILFGLLVNSWIVNVLFKTLFFRERPCFALEGTKVLGKIWGNSSFPSGHLAASVAALIVIFYLFKIRRKLFIILALIFIVLLGFARIYAGMHYPGDVLAGILAGIIAGIIAIWVDKQVLFSKSKAR